MAAAETQKAIKILEKDYERQKEAFEKWKVEHAGLAQHDSYAQYVEQFQNWEKTVVEKLRDMRASIARQPIAPVPELPTVDLDTQIENVLETIDASQFILAFMTMAQKDPTFLKKAFEVVMEECRGTGFSNPILPQPTAIQSSSTPSFGGYHKLATSSVSAGLSPANTSRSTSSIYVPVQQSQQYIPGSSLLSTISHYSGQSTTTTTYKITPYGTMPEGWTVDPAIRKQPKPASPAREYRSSYNLPFKDFSQT